MQKKKNKYPRAEGLFYRNARPARFAEYLLGVDVALRMGIIEIDPIRRTAIEACHGVGKTFILAVAALWWLGAP